MTAEWAEAAGFVSRGHRVASGQCEDPRFPEGTIALQLPFFVEAAPGFVRHLGGMPFAGTINLAFPDATVRIGTPEIRLEGLCWTRHLPPENFLLSACEIMPQGRPAAPAFLYIPDPATKVEHFQPGSTVELLAPFIPQLSYETPVLLRHSRAAMAVVRNRMAMALS